MRLAWVLRCEVLALLGILAGCGGGGGSGPTGSLPPPSVTLTSSKSDVAVNGTVTLDWSSNNASACTASGAWSGSLGPSGSQSVAVARTATYSISCTGSGGTANANVAINAWQAPSASITADSTAVLPNNAVTLNWSSQNATTCTGGGALQGSLATTGSQLSGALTSTATFSVACSNPAFPPITSSVIVTVSPTMTLAVTVNYQAPGAPIRNAAGTRFVPDWSHPVLNPVPFVYVELDNAAGQPVQTTFADANGVAQFTNLDPKLVYTPVIQSRIQYAPLGLDFVVLNNTAPLDTARGTFRGRYGPYSAAAPAFTAGTKLVNQSVMVTAADGWDAAANVLVDANRAAGPYALLASAVTEAQVVSAATGLAAPTWRPLTILWSVNNKGGLSAPPENFDQGIAVGSGGFWTNGHNAIDASGAPTGAPVLEDFIYLSGDRTFELMEIYPFVMSHEMGHFSQALFSTIQSPGGSHSYSDYEDPLLAWVEGDASGIAALVLNTPQQRRVFTVSGEIVVSIPDISNNTVNGNPQSWPVGWFQESTTTGLMWAVYNPTGTVRLSAPATLAPMFSSAWRQGPWLNTIWAYVTLLKQGNPSAAAAIDSQSASHGIVSVGNDVWGSAETHAGNRAARDTLPPYTLVSLGPQPIQVCSVGAPLEYNLAGNVRLLRLQGDGATHTLTVQGVAGTVPIVGRDISLVTPGSSTISISGAVPVQGVAVSIGECGVAAGEFAADTAACSDPAPPAEQCWSVTWQ
jgi:hypothetical protein